jgi:outer membrane protein assembly factor BamB
VSSSTGGVYLLRPGHARRIGTFGGEPSESGASTVDGRTLWAIVDHQRVVALDLANGSTQVRFAVTDQSLHGPIVFGRSDSLVFTTWTGVLVVLDPNGAEMRRTSLEPRLSTLITDAGKVDFAALEESPAPVTDVDGRVAFARVGGRIGVVAPDGSTSLVPNPGCSSPAALSPAGPKRIAVGCRDGTVLLVGDEP